VRGRSGENGQGDGSPGDISLLLISLIDISQRKGDTSEFRICPLLDQVNNFYF
jgi:hypothetical protein